MPSRPYRCVDRRTLLGAGTLAAGGCLLPTASASSRPRLPVRQPGERPTPVLNLRAFGAKGDGRTNDTDAFARAAAAINTAGRGTLLIPPGTYIVGRQTAGSGSGRYYRDAPILWILGCPGPVSIEGLGQGGFRPVLKAADGLRFGCFDPTTGDPVAKPLPFTDDAYRADAYQAMVELHGNASVVVSHLELDGNAAGLVLGGQWGDTGWQCAAYGMFADSNGELVVADVYTHHHGLDGLSISADAWPRSEDRPHALYDVVSEHNARQGLSWVGSSGLFASRCRFSSTGDTGVPGFHSAPTAGVDIEPENGVPMRGGLFEDCEMLGNGGYGVVSDRPSSPTAGSVSGVEFRGCTIGGTPTLVGLRPQPGLPVRALPHHRAGERQRRQPAGRLDRPRPLRHHRRVGAAHLGGVGNLIDADRGVTLDRCTLTAAWQRIGSLLRTRVRGTRFVANVPTAVVDPGGVAGDNWLVLLYFASVSGCTFEDALPSGGGTITINCSANPLWEGNTVVPGGRLALLQV